MGAITAKIKELQAAGMLERLSKRWERSVFQLYPKPKTEPRAVRRRKKRAEKKADKNATREMRADGNYRFSFNEKYRVNVTTGDIDVREGYGRGLWKRASDYHIAQVMYPSIRKAFSQAVEAAQCLQAIFGETKPIAEKIGSSDNAQDSLHNAQGSIHSAHPDIEGSSECPPPLRL